MALAMPEVQTPNLLAISASEIPYSRFKIQLTLPRTRETARRWLPNRNSPIPTRSLPQISFRMRSMKASFSLAGRYRFTLWSASRKTSITKSPPPKTLESYATLSPCPLNDNTCDHPPKLRINPPPTNSDRLP